MSVRRVGFAFVVTFVCALVVFTLPRFVFNTLQGAHERDDEGEADPAYGHQRAPSSLWTRDTSATFSKSGRKALSQAFSTTRARSSGDNPNAACAK